MENKRLPAIKTRIENIAKGKYVSQEGFNPNFVITPEGMKVSRVRMLTTVVDKFISENGKFASLTLDDGTETIRAKVFNAISLFDNVETGSEVDLIGKVKEYQGELFVLPEIIRNIEDPNEEILRFLELKDHKKDWDNKRTSVLKEQKLVSDLEELKKIMSERYGIDPEETEAILSTVDKDVNENPKEQKTSPKETLMKIISENDSGEGCEYSVLIEKSGLEEDEIDSAVQELLDDGTCFEPKPGKIKKL